MQLFRPDQTEMAQGVGQAVGVTVTGDVVRRRLGLRAGIAHGHPNAGVAQHLHIVAAIAESNGLFPVQPQCLQHMGKSLRFAAAGRQDIHKIIVPAHRRAAGTMG